MRKKYNSERGAVFIYILMAIVLLAALSYAISRGGRGNTSTLTDQQAKLAAQEIIEYGNTVAQAVQKLRLRGCSDTEVSFEDSTLTGYTNPNAPTDKSCHVFDIAGGNISVEIATMAFDSKWETPNINFTKPFFNGSFGVVDIGNDCANLNCSDLVLLISDLKLEVCNEINSQNNITPAASEGITNYSPQGLVFDKFVGFYNYINAGSLLGDQMTSLSGQNSGCFINAGGGLNVPSFYQVLIAR